MGDLALQGGLHGAELEAGLFELPLGEGAGDDPGAGEQAGAGAVDFCAAQGDALLAVAVSVGPADRAGVAATVHALQRADAVEGGSGRRAAHRTDVIEQ